MRRTAATATMVALMAAALVSHPDLTHSSLIKRREYSQEGTVAVSLPTYSEEGEIRSSEDFFFYGYRIAGGSGKQMKVGRGDGNKGFLKSRNAQGVLMEMPLFPRVQRKGRSEQLNQLLRESDRSNGETRH